MSQLKSSASPQENKAELEAAIAPLQAKLASIREAEERKQYKALVGRCFKFNNSYGGDRPRWWLYIKVTGIGEFWPEAFEFQTTCEQEIIIKQEKCRIGVGADRGYVEITAKEFNREWAKVKKQITRMKP